MSLLSLVGYVGWNLVLELLSHFKFQYLFFSFLFFCCLAITRKKRLILIGLFCLAINLAEMTSYSHYSKIPLLLSFLISIPIDHCLISPEIKVSNIETGGNVNSDHLPLIIDLVIPKAQ